MKRIDKENFIVEAYLDSIYYNDNEKNSIEYIIDSFCPSNFSMKDLVDDDEKCANGNYCGTCWIVSANKKMIQIERDLITSYK